MQSNNMVKKNTGLVKKSSSVVKKSIGLMKRAVYLKESHMSCCVHATTYIGHLTHRLQSHPLCYPTLGPHPHLLFFFFQMLPS